MAWANIKDSLPEHVQDYARNVGLLRKLKEDAKVDLAERTATAAALRDALDSDDDNDDDYNDDYDVDTDDGELDDSVQTNTGIDDDTLRLSYQVVRKRWRRDDDIAAADIPIGLDHRQP
jgi:hypothetical protein